MFYYYYHYRYVITIISIITINIIFYDIVMQKANYRLTGMIILYATFSGELSYCSIPFPNSRHTPIT